MLHPNNDDENESVGDARNQRNRSNNGRRSAANTPFTTGNLVDSYFKTTYCVYDLGKEIRMSPSAEATVRTANILKREIQEKGVINSEIVGDKIVLTDTGAALDLDVDNPSGVENSPQRTIIEFDKEAPIASSPVLSGTGDASVNNRRQERAKTIRSNGIFNTDVYSQANDIFEFSKSSLTSTDIWGKREDIPDVVSEKTNNAYYIDDTDYSDDKEIPTSSIDLPPAYDDVVVEYRSPRIPTSSKSTSDLLASKTPPKSILRHTGEHLGLPRRHTHVHFTAKD